MNAAIEDIYPLAPMQQGMLFHTLMAPGTGVYVEQLTCRIGRGLDVARFEQALQALVDRHAILRSVFAWDKLNEPLQIARRELRVPPAAARQRRGGGQTGRGRRNHRVAVWRVAARRALQ